MFMSVVPRSQGSSPRMRGAPGFKIWPMAARGIIPAYAGSTRPGQRYDSRGGDHPRVCGEHVAGAVGETAYQGSSPRMRGAPNSVNAERDAKGIIPAYAGSTPRR